MKGMLLVIAAVVMLLPDGSWCASKQPKVKKVSVDPCPDGVLDYFAFISINPFDNENKCFNSYPMRSLQILSRNVALYESGYRPGIFLLNFGKDSAPGEGSYFQGIVKGTGTFRYNTASGSMNTVHALKVLSKSEIANIKDKRTLHQRKKDAEDAARREEELRLAEERDRKLAEQKKSEEVKQEPNKANQGLTAVEWLNKAEALWGGEKHAKKYTDPHKAIEYLTESIRLDPKAAAYNDRGIAYADLKQYQQAINDYTQAIQLDPTLAPLAYNNRGLVYADLKHYQQAINDYDQAIRLNPSFAIAYGSRGVAYALLKQHQQAINNYTQAIQLDPKLYGVYEGRGTVYTALNNYSEAIKDLSQAIKLQPTVSMLYWRRGYAYFSLKQYQAAISDFDQSLHIDPNQDELYMLRAETYKELKEYPKALLNYNEAIRLKPKEAPYYDERGSVLILSGDTRSGCLDHARACKLGECVEYEAAQKKGICKITQDTANAAH